MTRYANIDDQNIVVSISSSDRQGWFECPDHVNLGWRFENGSWVATTETFLEHQKAALRKIDTDAEEVREQFATSGSLQAMVYLEKAKEARAYQAATNPIDTDYPFLKAEANALAISIADFAALVLQNRDAWTTAAAHIEAIRAAAKAAVRTAPDQSAIDTILNGLNWPTPQ